MTSPTLVYRRYVTDRATLSLRLRVAFTLGAVILLHLLAGGLVLSGLMTGNQPLAFGVVLAAYVAGLKHSYDWDHISAIDNSTRKFVAEGTNPASVGFAFSLGHSTIVTTASIMVVAGAHFVSGAFEDGSTANHIFGLVGAGISGFYLLFIGLFNGRISLELLQGKQEGHSHGAAPGFMTSLMQRPLTRVRRPRDIFVLGLLFGLGFDTATTIGLLLMTVAASFAGVSALALIGLPLAFTAAMTLCDTLNGLGMMKLYSSALKKSLMKERFNLMVTTVSSVSALFISVITLGGFFHDLLGLQDPLTTWLAELDLGNAGLVLVLVFLGIGIHFWRAGTTKSIL